MPDLFQPLPDTRATDDGKSQKFVPVTGGGYAAAVAISGVDPVIVTVGAAVEVNNDSGNPLPVSPGANAVFPVSGSAAVGTAPSMPPLSVSGVDSGGLKRHLLTDTAGNQAVYASARTCVGRQTITGLSSSTPATLTVPGTAVAAMIQADGGQVRITFDGSTNPTATVGHRIDDGVLYYVDSVLASVKLLAQSGSTTNVQIAYFDKA